MTPKVPADYREARRAQILNAAAGCFLEKGFHGTTMQDIFEASGLSAGAVYNYFEGKDEIYATMGEISRARNTSMASRPLKPDDDAPLATILESFFAMLKGPEAGRWAAFDLETFAEASRNENIRESIQANLRTSTDVLVPLVEQLQASGVYSSEVDARSLIVALSMLVQGMQILRIIDPEADLDAYVEASLAIARGDHVTARTADSHPREA